MQRIPKWQKRIILGIALGGIVFVIGCLIAGFSELKNAFSQFYWPYFLLGLLLAFLNYIARYIKFDYYLRLLDIHLPWQEGLSIFLSGLVMSITPGKMGEVLKSFLIKQKTGDSIARTAPVVVAERLTDFIAVLVLSLGGILSFKYGAKVLFLSLFILVVFFIIIGVPSIAHRVIDVFKFYRSGYLSEKLHEAYDSTRILIGLKPLMIATVISIPAWFFECLAFYVVIIGFQASITLPYTTFVYAFSTICGVVTPGGLGATDGGLFYLLLKIDIPEAIAVGATFVARICTLWFAVIVGAIALLLRHQKLSDLDEIFEEGDEQGVLEQKGLEGNSDV